jgi:hypothetical protein
MTTRAHPRALIIALVILTAYGTAACARGTGAIESALEDRGWQAEPYIVGAESPRGSISPQSCRPLYDMVDRSASDSEHVSSFHNPDTGTYALMLSWHADEQYSDDLASATQQCSAMDMDYGTARVRSTITLDESSPQVILMSIATVDETQNPIADIRLIACSKDDSHTLVRVMNSNSLDASDEAASEAIFDICDKA